MKQFFDDLSAGQKMQLRSDKVRNDAKMPNKSAFCVVKKSRRDKAATVRSGQEFFLSNFLHLIEFLIQLLFFHRKRGLPEQRRSLQR